MVIVGKGTEAIEPVLQCIADLLQQCIPASRILYA
jgi:hypothetical protein